MGFVMDATTGSAVDEGLSKVGYTLVLSGVGVVSCGVIDAVMGEAVGSAIKPAVIGG
ncbi:MAG: hypothetical protein J6586_11840 [Snodgrassella sp.]|nr:hypothetical protein [Snodgrassella sp.]MCO6514872.1 hypothetical protein [Snodgrassella sp.]MCO6517159.1 hypothetical protein [Snodgrassella sp.]MCO6548361.1 hypothetical protein [Gilliamella sp.]MCO6560931.1 hypothetical protein [Gilliamella sp.]